MADNDWYTQDSDAPQQVSAPDAPPSADWYAKDQDAPGDTAHSTNYLKTPGGLYHYQDAAGRDVFSKTDPTGNANARYPVAPDPAAGQPSGANAFAGAGKFVMDKGRGIEQLAAMGARHITGPNGPMMSDADVARVQAQIDADKATDAPLMRTRSGRMGYMGGSAAQAVILPAEGILAQIALGSGLGALDPVATDESRGRNAIMGGAGSGLGAGVGKFAGKLTGGFGGATDKAATNVLDREGIPYTVAQATGDKTARAMERLSAMSDNAAADFTDQQARAINSAVLDKIGVDADRATPDILSKALAGIRQKYTTALSGMKVGLDTAFAQALQQADTHAGKSLSAADAGMFRGPEGIVDTVLDNMSANGGYLHPDFAQSTAQQLKSLAKNPKYTNVAGPLSSALDTAIKNQSSPAVYDAWTAANRDFANYSRIENAADPTTGNISVSKLIPANPSSKFGLKANIKRGEGDQSLTEVARAVKKIVPDNLGNSGTAERAQPILDRLALFTSGDPLGTAAMMAASGFGTRVAGRALRSQGPVGSYLKQGLPGANAAAPYLGKVGGALGYGEAESIRQKPQQEAPVETVDTPPEAQQRGGRIGRAAGGRAAPSADDMSDKLIQRWHRARKAETHRTKPLLGLPDETITKALEIAHQKSVQE